MYRLIPLRNKTSRVQVNIYSTRCPHLNVFVRRTHNFGNSSDHLGVKQYSTTAERPDAELKPTEETDASRSVDDLKAAPSRSAPGNRCRNRYAFITGGTSGIGYATAKRFVSEGADRVVILTRNGDRGSNAVKRIKEETGLKDAPISVLTAELSEHEKISKALRNMPQCNTFINCAGISQNSLILNGKIEQVREILEINLMGSMFLAKEALRVYSQTARKAQPDREGDPTKTLSYCIVNVSSLLANKGGHGAATYAASKAGLIAFTRALSLEAAKIWQRYRNHAPPFRTNVVVPGYIDTPMIAEFQGKAKEDLEHDIPLGRFGTPDEVAEAILFLVENEYANNCVLNLDGGLSAT